MQAEEVGGDARVFQALLSCVPIDELRLHSNALVHEELLSVQRSLAAAVTAMAQLQEVQEAVVRAERDRADVGRTDSLMALVGATEKLQEALRNGLKRFATLPTSDASATLFSLPVTPEVKTKKSHVVTPASTDSAERGSPKRHRRIFSPSSQHKDAVASAGIQPAPRRENPSGQTSHHHREKEPKTPMSEVIDLLSDEEEEQLLPTQAPFKSSQPIVQRPPADPVHIPAGDEAGCDDPNVKAATEYAKRAVEKAKRAKERTNDGVSLVKCVAYTLSALRSLVNLGKSKHLQALPTQVLVDIAWSMDAAILMVVETLESAHGDTYHDLSYLLIELSRFFRASPSPVYIAPFLQVHERLEHIQKEGKIRICSKETIRAMWVNTIVKSMQIAGELDSLSVEEKPDRVEELLKRLCSFFLNMARRGRSATRYFTPLEFERVTIAVRLTVAGVLEYGNSPAQQTMLTELMQTVVSRFPNFRPMLTKSVLLYAVRYRVYGVEFSDIDRCCVCVCVFDTQVA